MLSITKSYSAVKYVPFVYSNIFSPSNTVSSSSTHIALKYFVVVSSSFPVVLADTWPEPVSVFFISCFDTISSLITVFVLLSSVFNPTCLPTKNAPTINNIIKILIKIFFFIKLPPMFFYISNIKYEH